MNRQQCKNTLLAKNHELRSRQIRREDMAIEKPAEPLDDIQQSADLVLALDSLTRNWQLDARMSNYNLANLSLWARTVRWHARFEIEAILTLLLFCPMVLGQNADNKLVIAEGALIGEMRLVDANHGWVIGGGRLLWTDSAGTRWRDVSPPPYGRILGVTFIDQSFGWVVKIAGAECPTCVEVASTVDGGNTWQPSPLGNFGTTPGQLAVNASLSFVDRLRGWIVLNSALSRRETVSKLLRTSDGGRTWVEIHGAPAGFDVVFTNSMVGWLVGGTKASNELYVTHDAGSTWMHESLPLPDSIRFAYELPRSGRGDVQYLFATPAPSGKATLQLLVTFDAGQTWNVTDRVEPILDGSLYPGRIPAAVVNSGLLLADFSGAGLHVLTSGIDRTKKTADTVWSGSRILAISFTDQYNGWFLSNGGRCSAFKSGCEQQTRLLTTSDGGETLRDITPERITPIRVGPRPRASGQVTVDLGLDSAYASTNLPSAKELQTWFYQSPYTSIGFYLETQSGIDIAPDERWISDALNAGWGLWAIWNLGPQSSCAALPNQAAGAAAGMSQAQSAASKAQALGLTDGSGNGDQTVIYYDFEFDAGAEAACRPGVQGLINAWTMELHGLGYRSGIYAHAQNLALDAQPSSIVTNVPDAIYISDWICSGETCNQAPTSTFGFSGPPTNLPDSAWASNQRIYQYWNGHYETWGSLTFSPLDSDVVDAPLIRHVQVPLR